MMADQNETTPLLGTDVTPDRPNRTIPGDNERGPDSDLEDSVIDDFDDFDEPINVFMTENGAPATSLGLSGGMDMFGTSFARRSSIPFITGDTSMEGLRRYASHPATAPPWDTPRSRRPSIKDPTFLQRARRRSSLKNISAPLVEHVEDVHYVERDPKYLYDISDAQFAWIFIGMLLTWFVASFGSTLMASSHPVITSYFNAANSAAWLSTSFLLTSTAFQPMLGRISDAFGRKVPFLFCMVIFTFATALCGVAQTIIQFILARALCGLGAGGAIALGVIIIADLIPLHRRAPYLAVLNLSYGVGTSLGAALGGFLADTLGWRWEFGVQVPALVLCLLVTTICLPANLGPCLSSEGSESLLQTLKGFDLVGSFLLTVSVTFLILGLNLGGNILPWDHYLIIIFFVLFALFTTLLIITEQRVLKPIIPLSLLTHIPSSNLIFSNFFGCITMNTILFNVPLYFQGILLDTPTRSGTRLIIPFVLGMAGSFATGLVINATARVKPCMVVGAAIVIIGSFFLAFMPRSLPDPAYAWIIAISTLGQGINFPTYSIGILVVTPVEDMAVALSTLFLFRNLGNVFGVAISSLVAQNALLHYLILFVKGEDAAEVIEEVRESVSVIRRLGPIHREQVINAYAAAMKMTFGQATVTSILGLLLVIGIRVPRLTKQKTAGN